MHDGTVLVRALEVVWTVVTDSRPRAKDGCNAASDICYSTCADTIVILVFENFVHSFLGKVANKWSETEGPGPGEASEGRSYRRSSTVLVFATFRVPLPDTVISSVR